MDVNHQKGTARLEREKTINSELPLTSTVPLLTNSGNVLSHGITGFCTKGDSCLVIFGKVNEKHVGMAEGNGLVFFFNF